MTPSGTDDRDPYMTFLTARTIPSVKNSTHRGKRSWKKRRTLIHRHMVLDAKRFSLNYAVCDNDKDEVTNILGGNQVADHLLTLKNHKGEPRYQYIPPFVTRFFEKGLVLCSGICGGAFNLQPDLLDCFTQNIGR